MTFANRAKKCKFAVFLENQFSKLRFLVPGCGSSCASFNGVIIVFLIMFGRSETGAIKFNIESFIGDNSSLKLRKLFKKLGFHITLNSFTFFVSLILNL